MRKEDYNGLYSKLKDHGVSIYAVAKAGGWSWQQVAAWAKGSTVPQLATFQDLQRILRNHFGIEINLDDVGRGGAR